MNQVNRKNDIYVACVSSTHNVCPPGFWVAIVSTLLEGNGAQPETEIQTALNLLGPIEEKYACSFFFFFVVILNAQTLQRISYVTDLWEPEDNGATSNIFVSKSYDATSHFQSVSADVRDIYKRLTGNDLVLKKRDPQADEENVE